MAYIRTFICFEIPESVKEQIADFQAELGPLGKGVRWVNPNSIHLTLKFLGDVEEEQLDSIIQAVMAAVKGCNPIDVEIKGTGAFPGFKRPRVYWVGVNEPTGELLECQQAIDYALAELGYASEKRRFSPHMTIGRVKSEEGLDKVSERVANNKKIFGKFTASEVIVMKSILSPQGAVYTPLHHIHI